MRFWIGLSQFFTVVVAMSMVAVAATVSAFVAAGQVERHIDDTIAQTVRSQINQSRATSQQFQQLVNQVNQICLTLEKNPTSGIHC